MCPIKSNEVFIVTSDPFLCRMLTLELAAAGYAASPFPAEKQQHRSPQSGRRGYPQRLPDPRSIVLADLDSPGTADTLIRLRGSDGEQSRIKIIYLSKSPLSQTDDTAVFIKRPFLVDGLISTLNTIAEQSAASGFPPSPADELTINERASAVYFRGEAVPLTKREYELLYYLWQRRGKPVSRSEAIRQVWGFDFAGDTNVVDVYIRYLRSKIDEVYGVKLIHTVRGKGYRI